MKIIITDLTRFKNPDIVCLAGIDPLTGICIRPMLENRAKLDYFQFATVKKHAIVPGSCLTGNFIPVANASPPHVEDHRSQGPVNLAESANSTAFEAVLENSAHTTVEAAFGQRPTNRLFGVTVPPQISIATLRLDHPATQFRLIVDEKYGPPKFKAHVTDAVGYEMSFLPVTDLGFSDHITKIRAADPHLQKLNAFLGAQTKLYLRIGLTRQYASDAQRDGFWVQLNGIYSFPTFRRDLRVYD